MRVRDLIKLITPPFIFNLCTKFFRSEHYAFKGVYSNISEVPIKNKGYKNNDYINQRSLQLNNLKDNFLQWSELPEAKSGSDHYQLLPFLVSVIKVKKKKIVILDFGGGAAEALIACYKHSLIKDIDFHIVETTEFIKISKKLTNQINQLNWYDSIPNSLDNLDIVNIGSSLQYVSDYKNTLLDLIEHRPSYILFTDTFMGKKDAYATQQMNIKGLSFPVWIFNLDEIIKLLFRYDYELIFKSTNFQNELTFDVPNDFQVKDSVNLLFKSF